MPAVATTLLLPQHIVPVAVVISSVMRYSCCCCPLMPQPRVAAPVCVLTQASRPPRLTPRRLLG
jgi:hypothetical protein